MATQRYSVEWRSSPMRQRIARISLPWDVVGFGWKWKKKIFEKNKKKIKKKIFKKKSSFFEQFFFVQNLFSIFWFFVENSSCFEIFEKNIFFFFRISFLVDIFLSPLCFRGSRMRSVWEPSQIGSQRPQRGWDHQKNASGGRGFGQNFENLPIFGLFWPNPRTHSTFKFQKLIFRTFRPKKP